MPQPLPPARNRSVPPDYVPFDPAHFPRSEHLEPTAENWQDERPRPFAWHVEQQARIRPDHLAVQAGTQSLTYGALNTAANRLAHYLLHEPRALGAPVALLIPQGAAALTVIVACLKAGIPYAAIDPALPPASIRALLASTQSRLLLCDAARMDTARAVAGEHTLALDVATIDEGPADSSSLGSPFDNSGKITGAGLRVRSGDSGCDNPTPPITPHTLAAITYTSGTTGQPKGIVHTHGSILQGVYRTGDYFAIAPSDRIAWLRPPSVYVVIEMFTALAAGATIFPLDPRAAPIRALAQIHLDARLTITTMAATVFRQLAASLAPGERFTDPRYFSTGGEQLYRSDVELYRRVCAPGCRFVTSWGATEMGGAVVRCQYDHTTPLPDERLVAGYPYDGVEFLFLDAERNPVAAGESGEIAVRSAWMPDGYWQQPDLTRERYIPDPSGAGRLFLTGDLGRLRPNGCLEFLGRKDGQVKVRGFRVEPAEVEEALLAMPGIAQAVVLLRHDPPAEAKLVAYLVPATQPPPAIDVLRAGLAARLPGHMVPTAFVFMDALPIASGGKLNRSLLPAPGRARPALAVPYAPPRTPVEERLARIWCDLFGLDAIGLHDPFLGLGGDSLLAGRIIAQVVAEFRVDLALPILFDAPTVYDMALLITARQAQQLSPEHLDILLRELEADADGSPSARAAE